MLLQQLFWWNLSPRSSRTAPRLLENKSKWEFMVYVFKDMLHLVGWYDIHELNLFQNFVNHIKKTFSCEFFMKTQFLFKAWFFLINGLNFGLLSLNTLSFRFDVNPSLPGIVQSFVTDNYTLCNIDYWHISIPYNMFWLPCNTFRENWIK